MAAPATEGIVMSISHSTEASSSGVRVASPSPAAEDREYSITPDRVGGIPRDFVETADEDRVERSHFSEGARTVLLGVGFGAGFGLVIQAFRLAAWVIAPGMAP